MSLWGERLAVVLESIMPILHYAYPITVFFYYIVTLSVTICSLQARREATKSSQHARRRLITALLGSLVVSFLLEVICLAIQTLLSTADNPTQAAIVSCLSLILVFGTQLALLIDTSHPVWYPYYGSWIIAIVFEFIISFLTFDAYLEERNSSPIGYVHLTIVSIQNLILVSILILYLVPGGATAALADDTERQPLLAQENGSAANGKSYGGTATSKADSVELPWERVDRQIRENMKKKLENDGNWLTYVKRFKVFLPYIWPVGHIDLQARAILVGLCLLGGNALNVLIPRQLGRVMDCLSIGATGNAWVEVSIFVALKWLNSEAGISMLRSWLWIPVEYYSVEAIDNAAYSHILSLSCDFHDSKSASDLIQAISKGESISDMMESVCFHAIPMLIDLAIAFLYLSYTFGSYEGFITLATAIAFLYSTSRLVGGLRESRRQQVNAVFQEHYVRLTGIQGWHTVSQFNQISYEEDRHSKAVQKKVSTYKTFAMRFYMSRAVQYLVLLSGLLAGAYLAVYQVLNNQATPGQFVMLLTYWSQLSSPLDFFAGLWKKLAQNLVNAERLLDIMETKPSIVSAKDAPPLYLAGGNVKFSNVCFTYDDKKDILKNISFEVPEGQTIAFVGATGAGKSTILKLLNRFYDTSSGSILIDGQDIREVDISSLRAHLGVVPQAPILFNDTVMNNIRYARLDATSEEVHDACKAACIHDQIMGFSDGYDTIVGERGVKLSGGELQRVAIARAILKRPHIVLLDEATSAVDTETEQKIQDALKTLCHKRTTFVVAHRLSTVVNADRIIVVGGGEIVEQGSHEELLEKKGKYANLWSKQVFVRPKPKEETTDTDETDETIEGDDINPSDKDLKEAKYNSRSNHSSSAGPRCDTKYRGRKKEGSKLDPTAEEFRPQSTTLSRASTVHSTKCPRETTNDTEVDNQKERSRNSSQSSITRAYTDGAADDEEESADEQGFRRAETSPESLNYKFPRYLKGVQSKSESGVDNEAIAVPPKTPLLPIRTVSAPTSDGDPIKKHDDSQPSSRQGEKPGDQ